MRIVATKRDAGFTESVALLDWHLDGELLDAGPRLTMALAHPRR
jgi:hypothetical protein